MAIITGISIGLLVAFGIWRANSALNSDRPNPKNTEQTINQTETLSNGNAQLTIIEPEENDIVTSSPVKVAGISRPNITLVISGENNDFVVKTAEDGSFEQDIDLIGGVNEIIFAHPENSGAAQTKSLRVIYSTEFEKDISK